MGLPTAEVRVIVASPVPSRFAGVGVLSGSVVNELVSRLTYGVAETGAATHRPVQRSAMIAPNREDSPNPPLLQTLLTTRVMTASTIANYPRKVADGSRPIN